MHVTTNIVASFRISHYGCVVAFFITVLTMFAFLIGSAIKFNRQPVTRPSLAPRPATGQRLMTVRWNGNGAGNQMFQLAATVGISRMQLPAVVWTVCADPNLQIRLAFPHVANLSKCVADQIPFPKIEYASLPSYVYNRNVECLPADRHIVLFHGMNVWRYFKNSTAEIRNLFQFSPETVQRATNLLRNGVETHLLCVGCFTYDDVIAVGVHVRRGNMIRYGRTHKLADVGYMRRATDYFNERLNYSTFAASVNVNRTTAWTASTNSSSRNEVVRLIFVVVSEDLNWCREALRHRNDVVYLTSGDGVDDMAMLSLCRHSIITVGTFGWWSAWLANGITVYMKDWVGPNLLSSYDAEDFFPPTWIGL